MRKSLYTAAVLAASTALLAGVTAVPAEARTGKEIKLCWLAPSNDPSNILKVVLDGPTSRSKPLANGECKSWKVKPGQYKVSVPGFEALFDKFYPSNNDGSEDFFAARDAARAAICGTPPVGESWDYMDTSAYVKRFKNDYYVSYNDANYEHYFTTTVQKKRQTKINFRVHCYVEGAES